MLDNFVSGSVQKRVALALSVVLIGSAFTYGSSVSAAQSTKSILEAKVNIDGSVQSFDQPAIVKNGATLVPLKAIFEALGASVKWDQATQTAVAEKDTTIIKITVGSSTAYINGSEVRLSAKAESINGRILVPLRFVSEALGANIKWDSANLVAVITSSSEGNSAQVAEELALVSDLNVANKLLSAAISSGQINSSMFDKVMKSLASIEAKVVADGTFESPVTLSDALSATGTLLKTDLDADSATLAKRDDSITALNKLQDRLGITDTVTIDLAALKASETVSPVQLASVGTTTKVNGINVRYGKHTYASKDQAEYDYVMKVVDKAITERGNEPFAGEYQAQFLRYLEGERYENYSRGSNDFRGLLAAHNSIGELVEAGVSKDLIIKASKAGDVASDLILRAETMQNNQGSIKSAYDVLKHGMSDCDADAQTVSAVFDALGFNTSIMAGKNHANVMIKINGDWWEYVSGSFNKVDMSFAFGKGFYMLTQPTTGPSINKADYK